MRYVNLTEKDVMTVGEMVVEFYREYERDIISVILYGGAAKTYVGQDHVPGDFDLNLFYREGSDLTSTAGMPKLIGEYEDLEVEVMRNEIPGDETVGGYIEGATSKRWHRIRSEPLVMVYPDVRTLEWFR